jgi:hypothetical protein
VPDRPTARLLIYPKKRETTGSLSKKKGPKSAGLKTTALLYTFYSLFLASSISGMWEWAFSLLPGGNEALELLDHRVFL